MNSRPIAPQGDRFVGDVLGAQLFALRAAAAPFAATAAAALAVEAHRRWRSWSLCAVSIIQTTVSALSAALPARTRTGLRP